MSAPTPAEMAAWPAPNYVNPSTLTNATISVTTIATVTMLPCVIIRLYFRRRLKGRFGIDDIVIIIAAVSQIGLCQGFTARTDLRKLLSITSTVLAIYSIKWGSGYHLWDVKPEWIPTYKKAQCFLSFQTAS